MFYPFAHPEPAAGGVRERRIPRLLLLALCALCLLFAPVQPAASADTEGTELLVPDPAASADVGRPPTGWQQTDADGRPAGPQWFVAEDEAGTRCVTSVTRLQGDTYLHSTFSAAGRFAVEFDLRTGPSASQRGLGFGLSQGAPGPLGNRMLYLAVLGNANIGINDGTHWRLLTPYRTRTWHRVKLVVDPDLGGASFHLDGRRVFDTPLALSIPMDGRARPDTVFLNNGGGSGETLAVRNVRITACLIPPAPLKVQAALSGNSVRLSWKPSAGAVGYRVWRAGKVVASLPADQHEWFDPDVQPGRAYAYWITALGDSEAESVSSWPAVVVVPVPAKAPETPAGGSYDVVVYGGTPGGAAAALAAARRGSRVALISQNRRLGGMMSGGLGITDIRYRNSASGIFKEMMSRMLELYRQAYGPNSRQVRDCNGGYWFEPRMAEDLIRNMVAEQPNITMFWNQELERVDAVPLWGYAGASRRVVALITRDADPPQTQARFSAPVFIDATYEGDLAAAAGAQYRVGREPRTEFGEEYAGVVYWDWNTMELLPATTGEGDRRVQAYNYRFTLTNRPSNRAPITKPDTYERYLPIYQNIARDVRAGRITRVSQVIYFGPLPNDKYDINNMGRYWPSTDHIEENYDYPTASPQRRLQIAKNHRDYILGLMYYLQHDPDLPEPFRRDALQWGLPLDEHPDSGHFPEQLYVREARRIIGRYIFTEHDARRTAETERAPVHADSIAVADYPLDSHATRKREPEHPEALEGFFYQPRITVPSQIPLGVLVPDNLDGVLVCCAVSATHVGYGTLRLEPVYMAMGEACGAAADLARRRWTPSSRIPALALQFDLTARGALLTFFQDLDKTLSEFRAFQFFGTRGFFPTYYADPSGLVDRQTAVDWIAKALSLPQAVRDALLSAGADGQASCHLTRSELTQWLLRLRSAPALRHILHVPGEGHPGGSFLPAPNDAPITRAELCNILWRMTP